MPPVAAMTPTLNPWVARMIERGIAPVHIRRGGILESQRDAEDRLLALHGGGAFTIGALFVSERGSALCGVSPEVFPPIAKTSGNLGSSMCGAALHACLQAAAKQPRGEHKPIFLASLGPGLLFGGGWLTPHDGLVSPAS